MASDTPSHCPYEGIKGCAVSLNVDSIGEAERIFAALSENGTVQMPLGKTFWGCPLRHVHGPIRRALDDQLRSRQGGSVDMRFMMLVIPKGYEKAAPGTMPDAKAVEAMMKYNEELQKAGVLLALDGLHPPSMGARVSFSGGRPTVTDGPFIETKEVPGGYWMIRVDSKEEAIVWASRCPMADNEIIEIRQVQEMSDFPPDVQKAAEGLLCDAGEGERVTQVMI